MAYGLYWCFAAIRAQACMESRSCMSLTVWLPQSISHIHVICLFGDEHAGVQNESWDLLLQVWEPHG